MAPDRSWRGRGGADDRDDEPADQEMQVIRLPLRLVVPVGAGRYFLALPPELKAEVASLVEDLRDRLMTDEDDPSLRRLYPTAYAGDAELDAEYQRLMRPELLASRLAAFDTIAETLDTDELTEVQLTQWMQAVNAVRLVVGTILDVGEDPDDGPDLDDLDVDDHEMAAWQLYRLLTYLLAHIVDALASP